MQEQRIVTITIPGALPTMNEIIDAAKTEPYVYSKYKKRYTELVHWCAKGKGRFERVDVVITWYCRNRKKDKDNIMAGQKFIFDGLQAAGVIANDGWKQIGDVVHRFETDKANPRVVVELTEVTDGSGAA
ncbi:Holliday junction resolvase [Tumebacillus lipolyticus]|uniref:Holliday junction resolvase n=1 Tax=Tumebacillus lipolyticus TaxID=1280370 RepID=A0ABW5A359_9BACL